MNEQNIEGLLKMLKSSVETPSGTAQGKAKPSVKKETDIETELRKKFLSSDVSEFSDEPEKDEYLLDEDFFLAEEIEIPVISEIPESSIETVVLTMSESDETEAVAEASEVEDEFFEKPEVTIETAECINNEILNEPDILVYSEPVIASDGQICLLEMANEAIQIETEDAGIIEEEITLSDSDITFDFEDALSTEMKPAESDVKVVAVSEHEAQEEEIYKSPTFEEIPEIDDSAINLLLDLGFEEEVKETVGDSRVYDFIEKEEKKALSGAEGIYGFSGKEYETEKQNAGIELAYKNDLHRLVIRIGITAFFTVVLFLHELFPLLGTTLPGIFDYTVYPVSYILIGLQFFMYISIAGFPVIKKGLRRILYSISDASSFAGMVALLNIIYTVFGLFAVTHSELLTRTTNTLSAITILTALVFEFLRCMAEREEFRVITTEGKKYTLATAEEENAVIARMYAKGLSRDEVACIPREVPFPKGYFRLRQKDLLSHSEKWHITGGIFIYVIIIASMLFAFVSMLLGAPFSIAAFSFMTAVFTLLPLTMLVVKYLPGIIASFKLSKQGTAVIGESSFEKYGKSSVAVFSDLHLFKPASPQKTGIVLYTEKNNLLMFRALDALFDKVGGPCKNLFSEVADKENPVELKVMKLAKNGIEARIKEGQTLIIGEIEYFAQTGIYFSGDIEKDPSGSANLYVAFDGKGAAKIKLKYTTEPIFETIAERLAENGIGITIETFDPLINGKLTAAARTSGNAPISVVHKNLTDLKRQKAVFSSHEKTSVVAQLSRLKLAEVLICCRKRLAAKKRAGIYFAANSAFFFIAALLSVIFGYAKYINQFTILFFCLISAGVSAAIIFFSLRSEKNKW